MNLTFSNAIGEEDYSLQALLLDFLKATGSALFETGCCNGQDWRIKERAEIKQKARKKLGLMKQESHRQERVDKRDTWRRRGTARKICGDPDKERERCKKRLDVGMVTNELCSNPPHHHPTKTETEEVAKSL